MNEGSDMTAKSTAADRKQPQKAATTANGDGARNASAPQGGAERSGVADGEARGRDAAELFGRGDARQVRVVVDRPRLVRDDATHRQHPTPQGTARRDGGHTRG